jgi:hypothetical protein
MEIDKIVKQLKDRGTAYANAQDAELIDSAIKIIETLKQHCEEMFPYFVQDVRQGLSIGPPPEGHDNDFCPDCQWYKTSIDAHARITGGEFDYLSKQ